MYKKRGFTLIELLVVISIIALLMAILMPSLRKARKQARAVVCQSNLKQLGQCFIMYAGDYDGSFGEGWVFPVQDSDPFDPSWSQGVYWLNELGPYYGGQKKVLLCPEAAKPRADMMAKLKREGFINDRDAFGSTFKAAIFNWDQYYFKWTKPDDCYSYGRNGFVSDPRAALKKLQNRESLNTNYNWRRMSVKGASNIPMLLDSAHISCWPLDSSPPLEYEDCFWIRPYEMIPFCMNRHLNGTINGVFVDSSVRKIGLKQLWTLKWSRNFNTSGEFTKAGGMTPGEWPEWMRKFKDY